MEDIDAATGQGWLLNVLPYLEDDVKKIKLGIEKRAMDAIRAQELTPETAMMLWQEHAAADRLLASFRARVKMGATRAQRASTVFELL